MSAAMAYDSIRRCAVLIGWTDTSSFVDTWEWDGTEWLQRNPLTRPPAPAPTSALIRPVATFDAARGRVLFALPSTSSSETTWEWGRHRLERPHDGGIPGLDGGLGVGV